MVYRFDPSTNRGFRYMYAVSIVRGWRLGAGESVRAGIRCEGLSEEHEREEDAERYSDITQRAWSATYERQ